MTAVHYGSVTRISDLQQQSYDVTRWPRAEWANGDYVQGEVTGGSSELYRNENPDGSMSPIETGDLVIGAFGRRAATLEGVGSFESIQDNKMHAMTSAGLFGAFTSTSRFMPAPVTLNYLGHVTRNDCKVTMRDFAIRADEHQFAIPTMLLVGTSMSAGKSVAGRLVVKELSGIGLNIIGCKLTGAGRLRDVLSFRKNGATEVFDFVDVGLPSTIVPEAEYRSAIRPLLSTIHERRPDFLVAEAGASPLEPYNGAAAMDELGDNIVGTILCASDPYAVVGVQQAFGLTPDLVSGPTTNTSAGIELVNRLSGVQAINILDEASIPEFRKFLQRTLGVRFQESA